MLRGELVGLRARTETDVTVLHDQLYLDVPTWSRSNANPWQPVDGATGKSPYAVSEPSEKTVMFSVVSLTDDALVGEALLWGIDRHNRFAHLGLSLLPTARGNGYGTDIVRVLCHYGFVVLGFNRLQIDTLADNHAMIAAAKRVGFVQEATLRSSAWLAGKFVDEVILGLLVDEWKATRA